MLEVGASALAGAVTVTNLNTDKDENQEFWSKASIGNATECHQFSRAVFIKKSFFDIDYWRTLSSYCITLEKRNH